MINLSIRVRSNTIEPSILRGLKACRNPGKVWQAGGLALGSMAQRAFTDASLRVSSWPPKWGKQPATLRKTGTLWRSIRVTEYSDRGAKVGSDRKYAAIHQFGGIVWAKPGGWLRFPGGDKKFVRAAQKAALKTYKQTGGKQGRPEHAGMVFAKSVKIPARPYFPFYKSGLPTFRAKDAISAAMRRALSAQIAGGTGGSPAA